MSAAPSASETLDREFLTLRARLIDLAAGLDRLDRAEGSVADDPRRQKIQQSLERLASPDANRAETLQMLFSLPYDAQWREPE
ncbi:MAG: hypothetical protein NTW96_11460 [Planctomycetia bacterium]|nr:hypothetical protein [Planctomycetia bacterium]